MTRSLVLAALLALAGLGAAAACGGTKYGDEANDAGGGETGTADVGADVDPLDAAPTDASGPDTSAPVVEDAGQKVDASACASSDCDCDKDGFTNANAGCPSPTGMSDCDDQDSRTRPDQGYLQDPAEPPRNADWNCSGAVEKFYRPNVVCTAVPPGVACDGTFGFEDDPACGATGTFVTCKTVTELLLSKCAVNAKSLATKQACK